MRQSVCVGDSHESKCVCGVYDDENYKFPPVIAFIRILHSISTAHGATRSSFLSLYVASPSFPSIYVPHPAVSDILAHSYVKQNALPLNQS